MAVTNPTESFVIPYETKVNGSKRLKSTMTSTINVDSKSRNRANLFPTWKADEVFEEGSLM
jgi:hypothetical protein